MPGPHGVDRLPANRPEAISCWSSSGSFHDRDAVRPPLALHVLDLRHVDRAGDVDLAVGDHLARALPSTGAAVITGEQIRTRRFALPIHFAIRCESASP